MRKTHKYKRHFYSGDMNRLTRLRPSSFLLGSVNVHIKMTDMSIQQCSATGRMETLIKTVKSIGHPVLYDLSAAGVLMQHLASDPQVNFQHSLSVTVLNVAHKPPKA